MKKRVAVTLFACLLAACFTCPARAENKTDGCAAACEEMIRALQEDPNISPKTKEALAKFARTMVDNRQQAGAALGVSDEVLSQKIGEWFTDKKRMECADCLFGTRDSKGVLERLNISGSIRMRYDLSARKDHVTQANGPVERRRDQGNFSSRFQLGFKYEVNDNMWVGARLTTGSHDNANTSEAAWGSDWAKWDTNFDLAFIQYSPFNTRPLKLGENEAKLDIFAGKIQHDWLFLAGPEFWDPDVKPTGLATGLKFYPKDCKFLDLVQLNLAGYSITQETNNDDASLMAAQLRLDKSVECHGKWDFRVAGAFYDFNDPESYNNGSSIYNNRGTDSFENGLQPAPGGIGSPAPQEFISDFELLHFYTEATYTGVEVLGKVRPITLLFEHMTNTNAREDEIYGHGRAGRGYNVMLYMGELKKQGDWRVGYAYCNFQRDSLFTLVSGNDFPWQTNYEGHWIDTYYKLFNNTTLHTQFFFGEQKIDDTPSEGPCPDRMNFRLRMELLINF